MSVEKAEKKLYEERRATEQKHEREKQEMLRRHKEKTEHLASEEQRILNMLQTHQEKVERLEREQKKEMDALEDKQNQKTEEIEKQIADYERSKNGHLSNTKLPECPVCLEEMKPPMRIFSCTNGHLICDDCKASVSVCTHCRLPYGGRATAMEMFIRDLLGVD